MPSKAPPDRPSGSDAKKSEGLSQTAVIAYASSEGQQREPGIRQSDDH